MGRSRGHEREPRGVPEGARGLAGRRVRICHSGFQGLVAPSDLRRCRATSGFVTLTQDAPSVESGLLRGAGTAESGNRNGAPWESRKANWAHLVVRSGRPTGCAGGEARKAPKPNERGYRV